MYSNSVLGLWPALGTQLSPEEFRLWAQQENASLDRAEARRRQREWLNPNRKHHWERIALGGSITTKKGKKQ